ncbi:MAG: glycosyltransferase [Caldilineaceae bacterium]
MKITFSAFGTRGDVQPVLALAKALVERGHHVRMIAGSGFAPWIRQHGVEPVATSLDIQAMMQSELGRDWIEYGNNPIRQGLIMRTLYTGSSWQMASDLWHGCQGSDLIISSFTSDIFADSVAEKLGCQHLCVALQPAMVATSHGPSLLFAPYPDRYHWFNHWVSYLFMERGLWQMGCDSNARLRRELLGLPPLRFAEYRERYRRKVVLHGYSPHVLPRPNDWPASFHCVGYWFLHEESQWQPSAELLDFLASDEPPIYVGFGSMTGRNPQAFTKLLLEGIRLSRKRAILLSGWAGIGNTALPDSVLRIDGAPHEWLFPRVALTVHHGGAGTTAASLRAGTPTLIIPHIAEQPLWGKRVEVLGVGPRAIPRKQLTSEKLAAAIQQGLASPTMRQNVQRLSLQISAEDGIGKAMELIERSVR